jgi:hypothetical protein
MNDQGELSMRSHAALMLVALLVTACATEPSELPPPPPGTPMKMRKLNTAPNCEDFQRNADGSWTAVRNTTVYGTHGAIAVKQGDNFRGGQYLETVDVAAGLSRLCLQTDE